MKKTRGRRLEFIERVGVETAAWPLEFWELALCLTHERATDSRHQERAHKYAAETTQFD